MTGDRSFSSHQLYAVMGRAAGLLAQGRTKKAAELLDAVLSDVSPERTYKGLERYGILHPKRQSRASSPEGGKWTA